MIPEPIKDSIPAKHHTPIYSVHRYFARRPHNVFRHIIEHHLRAPKQLILDPFAGGGVSIIEALTLKHRAIGYEINELAAFIIRNELTYLNIAELRAIFQDCLKDTFRNIGFFYQYGQKEVYWQSWVSWTLCPQCHKKTSLSPSNNVTKSGFYSCDFCRYIFKPKFVNSNDISPVSLCLIDAGASLNKTTLKPSFAEPLRSELIKRETRLYKQFQKSIYYKVTFSRTPIPECNLSKESALQKKGFNYFEDFFSYKAQAWIGAFATEINRRRIKSKYKEILFYILSASLRYISRFSTLNTSWRGEYKPLEWAKSNFWTPYSFVETNPFLAARDRFAAYERAIDDLNRRFGNAKPQIGSVNSVLSLKRQFSILNHSSQSMHELPDKSVDLILTDPPYGSYLHYGELSGYWICWLSKFHRSFKNARIFQNGEAVPSRKKYVNCKTFMDYENILTEIFNECYRVLKNGHYLVLTFNNKEPEAWIALLRSVKRAGFSLSPGGVLFQDGVEAYKRTIDLRRDGAIHGDFIYTFKKTSAKNTYQNKFSWKKYAEVILLNICNRKQPIGNSDLFLLLNSEIIPRLFISLDLSANSQDLDGFSLRGIEDLIKTYLVRENGYWVPKN